MTRKRLILMLLVTLMSATGAWATLKGVDYDIVRSSRVYLGDVNDLKTEGLVGVGFRSPGTVVIDAKESICLASYTLTPALVKVYLPKSVSIEGSNDNSKWTMLKSEHYTFEVGTPKTIGLDCNTAYRYYRFKFTGTGYVYLLQLRIFYYALDGDGTAANPYKLDDYQSWQMFYEKCATDSTACGKLTKDLNLNGRTWNPALDFQYTGTLDGNNHVISNLSSSVGLFQNTGAATIKNLTIENVSLTTTEENSGVIASQANGTIFENCIIKGSISSNGTNAGGLVGNAIGCTFTKCYSVGNYSLSGTNAGALVGNADGNTTFNQCFAATNLDNDGDAHLPMCGSGNATFNNTYYYGTGSATAVAKEDVGNGRLAYLLNNGNITGPYFQRIGTDAYPHFTKTGDNYVYLASDDASYTNACPHRAFTTYPFTAPSDCGGSQGNTEYAKCDNSLCGRFFHPSDKNTTTTNKNIFALSGRPVKLQEHFWNKEGIGVWNFSESKEKGGTTYYNVMEVNFERNTMYAGNYEFFYTVMDDDPTMNLHYFFNANMAEGSFSVRFYVNDTERTELRKNYQSSIEEQHVVVDLDELHKYDRIKVVLNYNFIQYNYVDYANLFVGQVKTLPAIHEFRKHELVYNCIDGGYQEHYECDICKRVFTKNTNPGSDADMTTLSNLAIAPAGAHNYKVIEGNLHGQECLDERCKAQNPNDYVLKNYNNGTDVPLTSSDGNSFAAKTTVKLTDAKEYVATVAFSMETLEYQRTFYKNVWNPWFVPFATTVSELAGNDVTDVACIESIHNYDTDDDGVVDKTVLEVILKKNGTVKAGVPYMVKTGDSYTYPMAFTNKVMNASTDDTKTLHSETISAAYDFMGTYSGLTADEVNAATIFSLNNEGAMVHRTGSILPQRWYMKEVSKDNVYEEILPAMARTISILVIGEEDEPTGIRTIYTEDKQTEELLPDGIFDLSGRRLSAPQSGKINIINGKKQFVK